MSMGRQKLHNRHLPPRMVLRHGAYYHTPRVDGRQVMIRLSDDIAEAMRLYHQREQRVILGTTVGDALSRYEAEVLPGKRPKTQYDYRIYLRRLREVFGDCRLESVRRSEVARYVDMRSAKIAANRELSCLSSVFQNAIRWGWCEQNPCLGAPRNRQHRRTRLPTEAEIDAIRAAADEQVRCMFDLVLLIGLRKGDMLKIRLADLTTAGLRVEVSKTGAAAVFEWSEGLREVIDRARGLRRRVGSLYLFASRTGQRYAVSGFDSIWRRTLERAEVTGLTFHDIRRWAINQAHRQGGLDYAQVIGVHRSRQSTEGYLVPGEVVVRPLR